MAKIFIVLALGFVVGFRGILKEKGLKINAKLQTVWLMLLIFCMGVSVFRRQGFVVCGFGGDWLHCGGVSADKGVFAEGGK